MNIFHKVAFQGLKKNKARTLVTIAGVVLSAALVTAGVTFGVSLLDYMVRGAQEKAGSWHVGFEEVDAAFAEERTEDKEAESAVITENIGYAKLEGSKNKKSPYLFITGYDAAAFDALPVELVSGRLPENSGEVLVSGSVFSSGGVNVKEGDILKLSVGDRLREGKKLGQSEPFEKGKEKLVIREKRNYTVVGICARISYTDSDDPGYTLVTKAEEGEETSSSSVFLRLKNPRSVRVYAADKGAGADVSMNDDVLRFMGVSGNEIFNFLLYTVGGIAVGIIVLGSVFLIRNAFSISLNERTRQFGILMSVGATKKQLRNSVLFEGLCIGAAGIPAGVMVGLAGTRAVITLVSENFQGMLYSGVSLKLVLSLPAILAAVLISVITIQISAYLPARKAVKTPVMECIRQTNEVKLEGKMVKTGRLSGYLFGLSGTLAVKNFKRNRHRYRSIIFSLALSIILFVATNSFVTELQQASEAAVVFTTYNIAFSAAELPDEKHFELWGEFGKAKDVTESFYQMNVNGYTAVETEHLTDELKEAMGIPDGKREIKLQVGLQIVDDDKYQRLLHSAGLKEDAGILGIAAVDHESVNRVQDTEDFADMFKNMSEELTLTLPAKKQDYQIPVKVNFVKMVMPDILPALSSESTSEQTPYIFNVTAPYSMKDRLLAPDTHIAAKGLSICTDNPAQTESDMRNILSGTDVEGSYLLINMNKLAEQNNNMIFIANVFCYTFIGMITLIAVANVFNTISTNIKLRRRELAMLRSVGMSGRAFQDMMNFECILYGVQALLWGIPLSLIISYVIYRLLQFGAENIDFVIPWLAIALSMLGVFLIVFVTMLYSIRKIKKENIIDALQDDMA